MTYQLEGKVENPKLVEEGQDAGGHWIINSI